MACYRPIPSAQDKPGARVVLWPQLGTANMYLPCGQCIGCKTQHANEWAHRCQHEATQWEHNIFLTLTYDDKHLPSHGYLYPHELAKFFKRLRKSCNSRRSRILSDKGTIRYFACGEYGAQNGRPHYHALLFNCNFDDRKKTRIDKRGGQQWTSKTLEALWPYGLHEFGVALPAAANYIAQYSLKKQRTAYWRDKRDGYQGIHYISDDGEIIPKPAPFLRMSQKPVIGSKWLDKYQTDLTYGYLVNNGRKFNIPRAYRRRIELQNPQLAEEIEYRTIQHRRGLDPDQHNNDDRRRAAEIIHERRKHLTEHRQ